MSEINEYCLQSGYFWINTRIWGKSQSCRFFMFCNCFFAFLSSYVTLIQYLMSMDQRKYSRPLGTDVTHYDVGGNNIPFMKCKKGSYTL